ncbi:hypothetical protein Tco_0070092, partial [Tanacetum coccineum]
MANHSQKWHDYTSSRNISSSSNTDGLAVIVRPYLDKECPLNEEIKQVEEVKYGEFGLRAPLNGSNGAKFRVGTDSAKITRKRSKPDKHGHGNGKSTKEPEVSSK